jgi:hypothetical protein
MTVTYSATRWALTTGARLAWATARVATRLGDTGERLSNRMDATVNRVAEAQGIDMMDVLAPLIARIPVAREA